MACSKWIAWNLIGWYVGLSLWVVYAPADREFWLLASILPALFVTISVVTHRVLPLSSASYFSITLFLTLHMIGVRYTYAQVPAGHWLDQALHLDRNYFDRLWSISVSAS